MHVNMNGNELVLMVGDITDQQTDAIVNAANGTLLGGGGVDGAIHRKAGKELLAACKRIRSEVLHGAELPTGEVVITDGFELPASYVIHTVGPIWKKGDHEQDILLKSCYENSLNLALEKGLNSIAFPSISTGVYRFPIDRAAEIAMKTIINFLTAHPFGIVKMVLFSEQDYQTYQTALTRILNEHSGG
ncbi:O-acetyl-ADP-ribose deacetylase [Lentibacillus sp. L22]|uniref:O-acetyl-ADP-ribose deacetylase n=1 Tax=Lentibacillus TaxID=175304 RepID=UPI0022B0BED3|nr:O-acetyl-ADP-ribose deacetylase [Lentibacillus daqui]